MTFLGNKKRRPLKGQRRVRGKNARREPGLHAAPARKAPPTNGTGRPPLAARTPKAAPKARARRGTAQQSILGGLVLCLVTFVGFGSWAVTAELSSAVIAPGYLTVSSKSKTVQHLEGGIVRAILVRDGAQVRTGDPLLRLDSTREEARHATTRGRYNAARATVARLIAERDGQQAVTFPAELVARQEVPDIARLLETNIAAFNTRRNHHEGRLSLHRQRIAQLQEEIAGIEAQARAMDRQIGLLGEEIGSLTTLMERGFAPRNRLIAMERERAALEGERAGLLARIAQASQAISETELQITQEEIAYRRDILDELETWEQAVFDLGNELGTMTDSLERTDIRAPATGTVVGMAVHTEGAVVSPGQMLLEIVPDRDAIVIEAKVRPQDIDAIVVGQKADVQISATSARDLGKLPGRVSYVSADSRSDPATNQPYFDVHVEIEQTQAAQNGASGMRLQPGMPAEVYITTGARTPFAYLVSPLTDSLGRAWRES